MRPDDRSGRISRQRMGSRRPRPRGGGPQPLPRRPVASGADRVTVSRGRGQVLVIVAFAMVALLGMTGVAVDLGFGVAHRRQVANAAEAAAIVGAQALARHIVWTNTPADLRAKLGLPTTDPYPTSAAIWQEMETAAAATVKPFTDLGATQTVLLAWPAVADNLLEASYIVPGTNAPNGTQGPALASSASGAVAGAPPANAVGVRVFARLRYGTFFARILGNCCESVAVADTARAVLKPLTGNGPGEGGPFIVCGFAGGQTTATPGPTATGTPQPTPTPNMGAWLVGPTPTPTALGVQLLVTATPGTPVVDYAKYSGATFRVHDEQLDNRRASCGAGDSYKGLESPGDTCEPPGVLPCTLDGITGTRAGPARDLVNGLPGCTDSTYNGCAIVLPIAANYSGTKNCNNNVCPFTIVTYGCFYIQQIGANSHNATLLPACTWGGQTGDGVIDPNMPGAFDFKLVLDCDNPTVNTCVP